MSPLDSGGGFSRTPLHIGVHRAEPHYFLDSLYCRGRSDAELLLQEVAFSDYEHFFHNWNDQGRSFMTDFRRLVEFNPNRYSDDVYAAAKQLSLDGLVMFFGSGGDLHTTGHDLALRYDRPFSPEQKNGVVLIFLILLGHR